MKCLLLITAVGVACAAASVTHAPLLGWASPSASLLQKRAFIYSSRQLLPYYYQHTVPVSGFSYSFGPQFTYRPPLIAQFAPPISQPAYFGLPSAPDTSATFAPAPAKPEVPAYPGDNPSYPGGIPSYPGGPPSFPSIPEGIPSFPSGSPSLPEGVPSFPTQPEGIPSFPGSSPTYPGSSDQFPGAPAASFPSADGGDKGLNDEDTISVDSA